MKISYGSIEEGRNYISNKVKEEKNKNSTFKVMDIGGMVNGWSSTFIDFLVDINAKEDDKNFKIDICDESQWTSLLNFVKENGKIDYLICTHTLEDLYNPITPLKYFPLIANSGIITMPSAKSELSRIEDPRWLGYIHHRWIFDKTDDNKMLVIPKLNFLENTIKSFDMCKTEIRFEWVDSLPYTIFMNNYLGPTTKTVISAYSELISKL